MVNLRLFLFFVLVMQAFHMVSQPAISYRLDSLQRMAKTQSGDVLSMTYLEIAKTYALASDTTAIQYAEKACSSAQSSLQKGVATFKVAELYRDVNQDYLQHSIWLKKALPFFEHTSDSLKARATHQLAVYYLRRGFYPEALKLALKALKIREKLPSTSDYVRSLMNVGYTYDRMGKYETAIKWHQKALEVALKTGDDELIGRSYGLIGIAYDELGNYDKALDYNFKAISYFKRISDLSYIKTWYSNIGNTYTKLEDYKNAEKYTQMALKIDLPIDAKLINLVNLGNIYTKTKRFKEAKHILDSAYVLIKNVDNKRFLSEIYDVYSHFYKSQNDFEKALHYHELYKQNEDEMYNEANSFQVNEMSVQYEIYEKENEILLQEAKIQKRNFQLFILFALFVLALITGVLVYKRQQMKEKSLRKDSELKQAYLKIENQRLLEQQRLSISRDLHDNIGAQLTLIISSLEFLKMKFKIDNPKMERKISEISAYTENTIGELRDTIWVMNQGNVRFQDLIMRMANFMAKISESHHLARISFDYQDVENLNLTFQGNAAIHFYRILQEAVNNAVKHAHAKHIRVIIHESNGNITLNIHDDGVGFNQNTLQEGNGFSNMKKRAEELRGALSFYTIKNGGVHVQFKLYLPL
jgi:signal transduction histidine kinase